MAELQSISWELGVSSSDGAGTWLGLRFQWWREKLREREKQEI
jgi:hypothetical protein